MEKKDAAMKANPSWSESFRKKVAVEQETEGDA
jgi:hypothetical protein